MNLNLDKRTKRDKSSLNWLRFFLVLIASKYCEVRNTNVEVILVEIDDASTTRLSSQSLLKIYLKISIIKFPSGSMSFQEFLSGDSLLIRTKGCLFCAGACTRPSCIHIIRITKSSFHGGLSCQKAYYVIAISG